MADTLAHMKVSITVTQLNFQPLFWHFKSGRWEDDQWKWSIIQPLLLASGGPVSVVGVVISHQVKLEDRSGVRKKAIGGEMKLLHRLVTNSLDDTVIFFPDMDTNSQVWAQCHGSKTESATHNCNAHQLEGWEWIFKCNLQMQVIRGLLFPICKLMLVKCQLQFVSKWSNCTCKNAGSLPNLAS